MLRRNQGNEGGPGHPCTAVAGMAEWRYIDAAYRRTDRNIGLGT